MSRPATPDEGYLELPAEGAERPLVTAAGWGLQVDDLALSARVDGPAAWRPAVRGLTLRVADEGLRIAVGYAAVVLNRVSQTKIEDFLDQLGASARLRSIRWYYASLLKLAAIERGVDVEGELESGAVVVRARFRREPEPGIFGQIRDVAKGAVTVTVRLHPSVGDAGRLRLRVALDPDVRGVAAKALVGTLAKRPGIHRVDDATIEADLAILVAQQPAAPFDWEAVVEAVAVTPEALAIVFGPRGAVADEAVSP